MFTLDNLFLLLTGLLAAYLCWYFWRRYNLHKALTVEEYHRSLNQNASLAKSPTAAAQQDGHE